MSSCNLDFPCDLAIVTLTYKILSGLYLGTVRCRKLILGGNIALGLSLI